MKATCPALPIASPPHIAGETACGPTTSGWSTVGHFRTAGSTLRRLVAWLVTKAGAAFHYLMAAGPSPSERAMADLTPTQRPPY